MRFHGQLLPHYNQAVDMTQQTNREEKVSEIDKQIKLLLYRVKRAGTLIASALSKDSMALSGSPKFNCALPSVTQACKSIHHMLNRSQQGNWSNESNGGYARGQATAIIYGI